jgi:hypothetical protein
MIKTKLLLGFIVVCGLAFSGFMILKRESPNQFLEKRAEFVMREIGHRILLHAGDSTSRVLPVKRTEARTFQLEFENNFGFVPDSLMHIVQTSLDARQLPLQYTVSVLDCQNVHMIYGYEVNPTHTVTTACLGRIQPAGCYVVQVIFLEVGGESMLAASQYAGISLIALALVGFVLISFKRKENVEVPEMNHTTIRDYTFNADKRTLRKGSDLISLTHKEAKVLSILTANVNQIVGRDHLLKEVWGNEGVIVGRSLDVFISKLRKKFTDSPEIRILNIHGNGYKLEID